MSTDVNWGDMTRVEHLSAIRRSEFREAVRRYQEDTDLHLSAIRRIESVPGAACLRDVLEAESQARKPGKV